MELPESFGGERVEKDDIRIEANGTIDELNTVIGIVRSLLPEQDEWHEWLYEIQMELMSCMSHVALHPLKGAKTRIPCVRI